MSKGNQAARLTHRREPPATVHSLIIVLGDQLDMNSSAFDGFDVTHDLVWMAEVAEESTHVWSSKQRIALFLSAMRHFAAALRASGKRVHYTPLDAIDNHGSLGSELEAAIERYAPQELIVTTPGDWRVLEMLNAVAERTGRALDIREDRHFYSTVRDFKAHAAQRKSIRLEYFYREMRKRHDVLMQGGEPLGGQWNYDVENRSSFGADGPGAVPNRVKFAPDETTLEVINLVNARFSEHPGSLESFAWPVTRAQALDSLRIFIDARLALFGTYQDAIWSGEPWLYHSHLAAALNLKLLNPREVVKAAESALAQGRATLASVEGFIRQILGWREYVRGIYWTQMPKYIERNALSAHEDLPSWYWTGETSMACLRDTIRQTLQTGYAHHIQRLMITGLYALLLGVRPRAVHEWYLSVYVDAVEWVELPNTLGMSQYGDDGLMASKPYVATGKYIDRMSNHCAGCRYDPALREGDRACPFTTLYWDFLMRHATRLAKNPRMALQVKNLARLSDAQRAAIEQRATAIRRGEIG
jgi:deoxyribodipyrimidine photolyase-related protein